MTETIGRMGIEKILAKKKKAIVNDWFDAVAATYAPDTAQFIKSKKDPFTNPVGGTLSVGLKGLFDLLLTSLDRDSVKPLLDPIVRIRAVQNFTPSQATAFIFVLKNIIRKRLKGELRDAGTASDLAEFEKKIDALSLYGFDLYVECREKIFELKANEEKDKIYKAFKRAGLIVEPSEE
jgi:hypothetical protein